MTKKSFYEILNSNEYSIEALQSLAFRMDINGPQYHVVFGKKYPNPKDSIENDDFKLKMFTPITQEITNTELKKTFLERFINHHKDL
jgi:hypothetical protein